MKVNRQSVTDSAGYSYIICIEQYYNMELLECDTYTSQRTLFHTRPFSCLVYVYHHISSHSIQTLTGAADLRNSFLSWLSVDFLESFSKMLGAKPSPASVLVVAAAELVAG